MKINFYFKEILLIILSTIIALGILQGYITIPILIFSGVISITGVFCNVLVMKANDNKMPVVHVGDIHMYSKKHKVYSDLESINTIKFYFLADILSIKIRTKKRHVDCICFSIGDILIVSGIAINIVYLIFS